MSPETPPMVALDDISDLVGPAAAKRGQTYARQGAVVELAWDPETRVLAGTVRGSTPVPYRCSVKLVHARGEFRRPSSADCTCPVEYDCKHAAALMFEGNRRHVLQLELDAPTANAATSVPDAGDKVNLVGAATTNAVVAAPPLPRWKAELQHGIAGGPSPGTAPATALGLLFELRELMARVHRWNAPTTRTAQSPLTAGGDYRLAVRPVIRSDTGNWIRGNITWNSLGYQAQRLGFDRAQHRWFSQFQALHRSTRELFGTQEADWLYLDDFESPLLWRMLDDAAALGVTLVSGKKSTEVRVGDRAELAVDASASEHGLRLTTVLRVDGHERATTGAGVIGDHGVYAVTLDGGVSFVLAPTASVLSAEQIRALRRPPIEVPAADVDEFLADFYPRLRRTVPVSSADASVALPELPDPVLVMTASFDEGSLLRLSWSWDYAGSRWAIASTADDGLRDLAAESRLQAEVERSLRQRIDSFPVSLSDVEAAEFTEKTLPRLQGTDGLRVEVVGDQPDYRELTDAPKLVVTTTETDRRDWFDLGVTVTVDGRSVPFASLFTALSKGAKKLLLIDNSYLSLEHPAFDELKRLIEEASELDEWETNGVRISRYQADLWAEFEDLADETIEATSWRESARGLLDADQVPRVPLPAGISAELRPYQQEGLDWLAFLHRHGLGGILADDMGLGKTLQTLSLIAHAREDRPFLVVAPTSVVSNWLSEAERYAPELAARSITATERKGSSVRDVAAGARMVVTSYALFRLDFAAYDALDWAGLILDEAQFVKNPESKAHRCAVELAAPLKIALTGTPMENSLIDLWAIFSIVAPGLFASRRRFTEEYVTPITSGESPEHAAVLTARLRRRIRPLMMRRTKELVATELPEKQEQTLRVDLVAKHRALYDAYLQRERQKLLGLVDDLDRNRFVVFRSLTLLRMLSLDASLIDDKHAGIPSAKLDALLEHLDDVTQEGHRALVFSQFTSFLKLAAARLDAAGIAYEYLDGSTLRRASVIDRFRTGDAPVFLISLKAGGFGLNLTEADYVFLLDPWWNPATESQAVDRTHRIGQNRPVNVYRMVSAGTIEEKVMALRDRKAELFDAVMDDDAVFSSTLTADDIRGLLES